MLKFAPLWIGYAVLLVVIARYARSRDALLPGKVNVAIQALAYVATYISAVALVGFGGLCYMFGMQMLLIAAGNVWLGTWFVYRYLAWPTRIWQRKLSSRTPAELLSKAYKTPFLQKFIGLISTVLLIIYGSAVFKGAAVMLSGVLPISTETALVALTAIVGISVVWGGLRGVLYTEAIQGLIMVVGVALLLAALLNAVGGPVSGLKELASLPATKAANNGFLALSDGPAGLNIIFLTIVTSVGIWAQPQLIQRHFALKSADETRKAAPMAMLALSLVVGGAYFASALSRLLLGDKITNPDIVMPTLVHMLLPAIGQQIFALAIVSASLSTASALLHIASGSLGRDVLGKELHGWSWRAAVIMCTIFCGLFAIKSSSIIALICATSWTILACTILVPYIALLVMGPKAGPTAAVMSSVCGFAGTMAWYLLAYAPTSSGMTGLAAPGWLGAVHPIVPGILLSFMAFVAFSSRTAVKTECQTAELS
jgi:SSS family solute:Na+ symporter